MPPWPKGKSANPGGKTAAQSHAARRLSRLIGEISGDGEEMVRRLFLLSRGVTKPEEMTDAEARDGRTKAQTPDRQRIALAATIELHDRFAGRAPQTIEIETDTVDPEVALVERMATMTPTQIAALAALGALDEDGGDARH